MIVCIIGFYGLLERRGKVSEERKKCFVSSNMSLLLYNNYVLCLFNLMSGSVFGRWS